MQGLFTAASGILANQARMNIISNNIANVNTIGFKSAAMQFSTVFSNTISGGTNPNGSLGGTNPVQVGNGTRISGVQANFGQGGTQFTGRQTDLMIDGNGFFAVERVDQNLGTVSSSYYLTRAGNFTLDSAGNMVTASGNRVRGTSQLSGSDPTTLGTILIPQEMVIVKDLDAAGTAVQTHFAAIGTPTLSITAAMNAGAASQNIATVRLVNYTFGKDGAITASYSNGDRISLRTDPNTISATDPTQARREIIHMTSEGLTFGADNDADGNPSTATDAGIVDQIASYTVFTGPTGGNALEGMQMQMQTATVTNPAGLLYDGGNNFLVGANSGTTYFGAASNENRGNVNSGALESSNVDLASEFTNMVVTQRGLEASSRMIRTQSEILQNIIQSV